MKKINEDTLPAWMRPADSRKGCAGSSDAASMKGGRKPNSQNDENARYSYDGLWTTKLPASTAFSKEWFKEQTEATPYSWDMFKMAYAVSKVSVITVALGTIGRAVVDVLVLYVYTRFVNEVLSPISHEV